MTDPETGLRIDPINLRVRYDYDAENGFDEIAYLFPRFDRGQAYIPFMSVAGQPSAEVVHRYTETATDTHHISGGILGTPRYDLVTNLIRLSRPTHVWCERYVYDGFALCYAAKVIKFEWDGRLMSQIMGIDSIDGWLLGKEFEFPWTRELLEIAKREAWAAPRGELAARHNDLTARILRMARGWRDVC